MEAGGEEESQRGQVEIWKYILSMTDCMALKCAVELRIPDIINSHGAPITLSQISADISGASSPDIHSLSRIMRLLARRNVFTAQGPSDATLYGLTRSSRLLLRDTSGGPTLAPMVAMGTSRWLMASWQAFSDCVKHSGLAFQRANGSEIWDLAAENSEFNKLLNDGMECLTRIAMGAVMAEYGEGFGGLRSLVDVGGGTGSAVSEIVKSYPHIEGINFDLPHVVATAPPFPGVSHVGGDMFTSVPAADAIFMKCILHDWGDEECVKILRNCRRAIPEKCGKIIIVDSVLDPQRNGPFDDMALRFDLLMVLNSRGKERTENEWKILLKEGGFPRFNIIKIPALQSIIEAYPV